MKKTFMIKRTAALAATAAVAVAMTGCDEFLTVRNPTVVEASTVDPVADAETFSRSAFQNFAEAHGRYVVFAGWYTNEIWVGDTFPTINEYGRRIVSEANSDNSLTWTLLQRGIASSEQVIELLSPGPNAAKDVNIARAALSSGFGTLQLANFYCQGTIRAAGAEPGPVLSREQLLDRAIERFNQAITLGTAAGGADATAIINAARVGLAEAQLAAGRHAAAVTAASAVPNNFTFNLAYVDDASNRGRLGNRLYFYSAGGSREALVVAPHYRAMNDPRIPFNNAGRLAQDATLQLWNQRKYTSWQDPIRLASGLQARYIVAEAQLKQGNPAPALALIAERRTAGNQGAFVGAGTAAVLAELMAQSSRDFWLEGRRLGDWRRNPAAVPNILQPGNNYYKPALGAVSDQTCVPVPQVETSNNPNFPRT